MATKKKKTSAVAKRASNSALALPNDLREEFAGAINRDSATAVSYGGWPVIRVGATGFKLGKEPLPNPLALIVLGGIRQNVLYEGAYVPGESSPASCAAVDAEGNPDTMAAPAEFAKSPTCASCGFNAWGSSGRGKACSNRIKLAVFPYDPTLDYASGKPGAILNLSPTALKPWSDYVSHITGGGENALNRPLFSVVTNFDIEVLTQGFRVSPSLGGTINDRALLRTLNERAGGDACTELLRLPQLEKSQSTSPVASSTDGVTRRKINRKR